MCVVQGVGLALAGLVAWVKKSITYPLYRGCILHTLRGDYTLRGIHKEGYKGTKAKQSKQQQQQLQHMCGF